MIFEELEEFTKDKNRLLKKYRSINDDLIAVKLILKSKPNARPPFSYNLDNLGLESCVIKVKKIACKSLKGKGVQSGLRLIYAHFETEKRIVFVELYHKNEKDAEDRQRILSNFV